MLSRQGDCTNPPRQQAPASGKTASAASSHTGWRRACGGCIASQAPRSAQRLRLLTRLRQKVPGCFPAFLLWDILLSCSRASESRHAHSLDIHAASRSIRTTSIVYDPGLGRKVNHVARCKSARYDLRSIAGAPWPLLGCYLAVAWPWYDTPLAAQSFVLYTLFYTCACRSRSRLTDAPPNAIGRSPPPRNE